MGDNELVEVANRHDIRFMFNRFDCNNIEKAFQTSHELNEKVKTRLKGFVYENGKFYRKMSKTVWRVGRNYDRQVVIDIDHHDLANLIFVNDFYSTCLNKEFHVIKTLHGYHLIQREPYKNLEDWIFGNCLLLNPNLKMNDLPCYIKKVMVFDDSKRIKDTEKGTQKLMGTKEDYIRDFKASGLWQGVGDFDILYNIRGIYFKKYTLRISKKKPNDRFEIISDEQIREYIKDAQIW